jgi:hypothetical protein
MASTSGHRRPGGPTGLRLRNEARCRRLAGPPRPLTAEHLDPAEVAATALDADTLACLVYMRDVEGFTDRDLVGFAGHPTTLADPVVASFLPTWRAEEAAHAAAVGRFLDLYREGTGTAIPDRQAPPPSTVPRRERLAVQASRPVGHVVVAAHMVWGAANELLTLTGYRLLAARCGHPVLAALLRDVAAQESRHFSFYALQAEWRLADSGLARRAVRRMLARTWTPVGIGDGYKPQADFDRLLRHLVPGDDGIRAVRRMDARVDRLPGLAGLGIYARALAEAA